MQSTAESRRASGVDRISHAGVQPWSAGPIFPAVIGVVERYEVFATREEFLDEVKEFSNGMGEGYPGQYERHLAAYYEKVQLVTRLETTSYELTLAGRSEEYATRDDAEGVARYLLANPDARRNWSERRSCGGDGVMQHDAMGVT